MLFSEFINGKLASSDKIHIAPHIPTKKAMKAILSYAKEIKPTDIIILCDDTVFGSASDGFIITNDAFFFKEPFGSLGHIKLSNIEHIYLNLGVLNHDLICNGKKLMQITQPSKNALKEVFEHFANYIKKINTTTNHIHNNPNNTDDTSTDEIAKLKQELENLKSQLAEKESTKPNIDTKKTETKPLETKSQETKIENSQSTSIFQHIQSDDLIHLFLERNDIGKVLTTGLIDAFAATWNPNNQNSNEIKQASRNFIIHCVLRVRKYIDYRNATYFQNDLATLESIVFALNLMHMVMNQRQIPENIIMNVFLMGLEEIFKDFSYHEKENLIRNLLNCIINAESLVEAVTMFYTRLALSNFIEELANDELLENLNTIRIRKPDIMENILLNTREQITNYKNMGQLNDERLFIIIADYLIQSVNEVMGDISSDKFIPKLLGSFINKVTSAATFSRVR